MDWFLIAESSWASWWLVPANWLAMFKVAAGLGFVIFVHELGHFLVAKACGVKCEKFYIGFDIFEIKFGKWTIVPRALFKFKYGETEYGIGILPLGGYVKMLGQDDNPRNLEKENERSRIRKQTGEAEAEERVVLDPRSYLAKSVPQRMAIISAGVIMNLIFAVIFATIAYLVGVPYLPCIVGDTVPGGAAWRAGVNQGDKVIQINGAGRPSEHLRWDWDLRNATGMAGTRGEVELLLKTAAGTETVRLKPREIYVGRHKLPTLGVLGQHVAILNEERPALKYTPADNTKIALEGNDRVVAIRAKSQAEPMPIANRDHAKIEAVLVEFQTEPVIVTVERTDKKAKPQSQTPQRLEIEIAPNPWRTLGLVMQRGPITGVRPGSPAEKAGLKEGDIIRRFAGQRFGDPMTVPDRLAAYHGRQIPLEIDRPDSDGKLQPTKLQITPETPRRYHYTYTEGADFSVETLGIVYPVFQIVQDVQPSGPAASAGLKAGDVITQIQFVPKSTQLKEEKNRIPYVDKPLKLNPNLPSWPRVEDLLQHAMPETQVKLVYERPSDATTTKTPEQESKGKSREVLLSPIDSSRFNPQRGLNFALDSETRTAKSLGEALSLGLRQTYEDGTKIILVLRKLVSGEISLTNLAGPASIAYIATSEAAQGTSRLLIFLTFLSANLAVVNFLPIPVLDGGHMMFLAWEGIFRRPVPEKWQFTLTILGLAVVLSLFLFTNSLDFFRFVIDPFL